LPDYFVARYPLTVAQFGAFVEDTRFQVGDRNCLRDAPNHPVRWVSFHEALAYCRWLTDTLRTAEFTPLPLREHLAAGWVITLPSEAEWEKAARGTDGRIYPWGDTFKASNANGNDSRLGTTSPVGLFPNGASPCGALDMSGNVWEWTRSLWGTDGKLSFRYPYEPRDAKRENLEASDDVWQVLRGGAFVDSGGFLRAAKRYWGSPGRRYNHFGFRVAFSRLRS
jgi:formylglycine-generating enzyme required for sulfatase activity